jgi:hypothetical protein
MVQRQKEDGEGIVERPAIGEKSKEKSVVSFYSEAKAFSIEYI